FSKMGGKVGSGEPARPANASLAESRGPSAGLQTLSTVGRPASANGSLPSIPVSGGQAEIEDLRERILRITEELLAADLITATGGNVSVRIPGAAEALVTPSQLDKGALSKDMMVRIDLEGNALDPDALAPSSESQLHSEIYKARLDVEAVIHTHATFATILGVANLPFLPVSTEAAFLGEIPRVPFIMPGSAELAKRVREALGDGMAVVLQNHGLVTTGSTLEHAANTAKLIERTSQIIWCCYALGKKPRTLPKNVLGVLREIGRMIG
ncbi:MAG: class II aldolase/adducin family protein, partial [Actinobacteria bacterium]|nr:class II aldolase/adducin family protein [Actinomycetota bacterium]